MDERYEGYEHCGIDLCDGCGEEDDLFIISQFMNGHWELCRDCIDDEMDT